VGWSWSHEVGLKGCRAGRFRVTLSLIIHALSFCVAVTVTLPLSKCLRIPIVFP